MIKLKSFNHMNIYITLDYELFLSSQTGTVANCLLKPTTALLEVLDKYGIKATFFVDAAYLLRLSQIPELKEDYDAVSGHVKFISEAGHSIQIHFHPQWLYSSYSDGLWSMDMEHYKMSNMSDEDINSFFVESYNLLQSLSVSRISTFRAGGYSLMDFSRYKDLFCQLGIKNDSSVLRGSCCASKYQNYDFSVIPQKSHYSFSKSIIIEDLSGCMIEYPISTFTYHGLNTTVKTFWGIKKTSPEMLKKWGDGKSVGMDHFGIRDRFKAYLRMIFDNSVVPASLDSGAIMLREVVSDSLKIVKGDDVVIIGHPKNLNKLSMVNLECLIKEYGSSCFKVF